MLPELSDLAQRRKAHLLQTDLASLAGLAHDAPVPAGVDPPVVASRPAVLGCLYVTEGATLGGRELGRRLEPVLGPLGLPEPEGRRFLLSYGARQGAMWRQFCAVLERVASGFGAAEHEEMQTAARNVFLLLEQWLTRSLRSA